MYENKGLELAKYLILMLFYVFLHHFLLMFLIFNNFLCFPLFLVSFGSLPPPLIDMSTLATSLTYTIIEQAF